MFFEPAHFPVGEGGYQGALQFTSLDQVVKPALFGQISPGL
jgi:hypothetical protein